MNLSTEQEASAVNLLELCAALISIDSINPFQTLETPEGTTILGKEAAILDFCEAFLTKAGFSTKRQECGGGRQNLLAEKGHGTKAILLYGHVDTVEVKEGWSTQEALTPKIGRLLVDGQEEEILYGLGSNDMKGGVAVLLHAAATFQPQHLKLKVALGCDEEFWSLGSLALVRSDFLDDVCGILVPEVGEPTSERKAGHVLATMGRCGRVEFCIHVPGSGGHGAEPDRSDRISAITQAAKIALAIEEASRKMPSLRPFQESRHEVRASALVTKIEGGEGVLSVPDATTLIVNRVLVPGETAQTAFLQMQELLEDLRRTGVILPVIRGKNTQEALWPILSIRPRPTPPLQPYALSLDHPFAKAVLSALAQSVPYEIGMGICVADENRFGAEAKKPVVVLGPRGEEAHAAWEWVSIPSLFTLEALYLAILQTLDRTNVLASLS